MSKIPWTWFDYRADLPKWLITGIGEVAVEWSILEREIEELIRLASDMPIKTGRIATFQLNMGSRLVLADNFIQAHVYHGNISGTYLQNFKTIKKGIEKAETERNLLVHCLWERRKGEWRALRTRGSQKVLNRMLEMDKLARAVLPNSEPISAARLNKTKEDIITLSGRVVSYCAKLESALPPLQHKSPQYTRRRHPSPGHKTRK